MLSGTQKKISGVEVASLNQLITAQLQDLYWAEEKILNSLPDMIKNASDDQLKQAFQNHHGETKTHVERLKKVFEMMGESVKAKKCEAMAGLAKEAEGMLAETPANSAVRDCALIIAAQKIEHYEIASYGCLRTLVRINGHKDAAALLQITLDEEHAANELLTDLAEGYINKEAASL